MPNIFHNSLSLGYSPSPSYPTDGLIARYSFDDTLNDSYGSNNGFVTYPSGTPSWTYDTGLINKAVKGASSGNNTLRNTTDSPIYNCSGNTAWSVSVWIKITNTSAGYQKPINFSNIFLGFGGSAFKPPGSLDGNPFLYTTSPIGYYAADMRDNTWHHYAIVDDNSTIKLYIDTTERISTSSPSIGTSSRMEILAQNQSWYLNGYMDLLYLYNKALTTTEISQLYNSGSGV